MSQHDYVLDNQSGSNFRSDMNLALGAIATLNSGNTAPATTYAYMLWVDTSGGFPVLKQRNAANSAWITIGRTDQENLGLGYIYSGASAPATTYAFQLWVDTTSGSILKLRNAANSAWITIGNAATTNLGLLPLTGGTLTGALLSTNTDHWKVPVGTTGQRDGSPADGMVRYNSTLVQYEGYSNGAWSPIGGGGLSVTSVASISGGGTVSSSTTESRQLRHIQGNAGAVDLSTTPFGASGGWRDGTEILLVGNDDTNSVSLVYNDAAKGAVGNFSRIEITKYKTVLLVYSSSLDRWIVTQGA
jgi:hypothetical protein